MFGRKQIKVKEEKDEELMMLVYRVRDQMAAIFHINGKW